MYGTPWLSEGIPHLYLRSPPILAFHLSLLDHRPSGHLQQDT